MKDNWVFLIRCSKSVTKVEATLLGCLLNPLQAETHSQTDSVYWQVKETESPQQTENHILFWLCEEETLHVSKAPKSCKDTLKYKTLLYL